MRLKRRVGLGGWVDKELLLSFMKAWVNKVKGWARAGSENRTRRSYCRVLKECFVFLYAYMCVCVCLERPSRQAFSLSPTIPMRNPLPTKDTWLQGGHLILFERRHRWRQPPSSSSHLPPSTFEIFNVHIACPPETSVFIHAPFLLCTVRAA